MIGAVMFLPSFAGFMLDKVEFAPLSATLSSQIAETAELHDGLAVVNKRQACTGFGNQQGKYFLDGFGHKMRKHLGAKKYRSCIAVLQQGLLWR